MGWSPWWCEKGWCQHIFLKKLSLKMIDNSFIVPCIVCEITLQNQKGYVVTYWSPSQSITKFEFLYNSDKPLNHIKQFRPSFTIILGDFNARSKSWWSGDVISWRHTYWVFNNCMVYNLSQTQLICFPIHHHVLTLFLLTNQT